MWARSSVILLDAKRPSGSLLLVLGILLHKMLFRVPPANTERIRPGPAGFLCRTGQVKVRERGRGRWVCFREEGTSVKGAGSGRGGGEVRDLKSGVVGCGLWVVGCGLWVVGCGLWVVGCGLWVVGCGLWVVGCGLWVVGCGLWVVGCGLWVVGCGLWVVGCGLWVVGCGLWVVGCGLWVVGCGLWVVGCGLWVVGCGSGEGAFLPTV